MNLMKKKYLIGTVLSALVLCIIGIYSEDMNTV